MFVQIIQKSEFSSIEELIGFLTSSDDALVTGPSPKEVVDTLLSRGWSQRKIARAAGISEARISAIKQGDHLGSVGDREKLGALLQLPARWLIG